MLFALFDKPVVSLFLLFRYRAGYFGSAIFRCCQTNANQSLVGQGYCPLCGAETAPLCKSGGAVGLEMISLGKTALLVEMIEDEGMDGGELL